MLAPTFCTQLRGDTGRGVNHREKQKEKPLNLGGNMRAMPKQFQAALVCRQLACRFRVPVIYVARVDDRDARIYREPA